MSLNLHGVVRATHPRATDRARLVTWRDLAMVVSEVSAWQQQDALAHLETLSSLVLAGPVVPLRFGTTAADEETVRTGVLAATATSLRGQLDRLDGVVEVHAYLRFDEDAALRAVHNESQTEWRVGDDLNLAARIRLGERVAQHLTAWRHARSDQLLAPVTAVAQDQVRLTAPEHTEERRAFLIPTGEIDTVRTEIASLSGTADVDAECVGPLPAYSFLDQQPTHTSRWGW